MRNDTGNKGHVSLKTYEQCSRICIGVCCQHRALQVQWSGQVSPDCHEGAPVGGILVGLILRADDTARIARRKIVRERTIIVEALPLAAQATNERTILLLAIDHTAAAGLLVTMKEKSSAQSILPVDGRR